MLWRPAGVEAQDVARWDSQPERSTFFLQLIATEKREGRFLVGNPTNAHYNLLIKSFWEKFQVYHTKAQFKNHFTVKKQLWSLLSWAQNCTGISWDHGRKMVIASPEWWDANKERKGLSSLKDKAIPDYELLEFVYRGQHADGAHMRGPRSPRFPRTEGVGDSARTDDLDFNDHPDISLPEREAINPRRRNATPSSTETQRKKQHTKSTKAGKSSSPIVQDMDNIMGNFFDRMEDMRSRREVGVSKTVESVAMQRPPANGSFVDVVRVLVDEMKMDVTSDLFQDAQDLFLESKHLRELLLHLLPETRWPWLTKTLARRNAKASTPSKNPCPAPSESRSST